MERNWTFKLIRVERREKAFLFQDTKHELVHDLAHDLICTKMAVQEIETLS